MEISDKQNIEYNLIKYVRVLHYKLP